MAPAIFLADTSIHALRHHYVEVARRMDELLVTGRLASCQMGVLEVLNQAVDPRHYEDLWAGLHGQRWIDTDTSAMNRALDVHRKLGRRSQHRNFSLPDLIIAATAELNGATVLHYDQDYDRIAEITGQPVEWVVPRGSLRPPSPPEGSGPPEVNAE